MNIAVINIFICSVLNLLFLKIFYLFLFFTRNKNTWLKENFIAQSNGPRDVFVWCKIKSNGSNSNSTWAYSKATTNQNRGAGHIEADCGCGSSNLVGCLSKQHFMIKHILCSKWHIPYVFRHTTMMFLLKNLILHEKETFIDIMYICYLKSRL